MRIRSDIDQRLLSELFYRYLNEEEDFVRELFTDLFNRQWRREGDGTVMTLNIAGIDSFRGTRGKEIAFVKTPQFFAGFYRP